jgi:hypothetical protein
MAERTRTRALGPVADGPGHVVEDAFEVGDGESLRRLLVLR